MYACMYVWQEKSHFVARVFLCSSPAAYFCSVKALLVATAAYGALWCVNFASISAGGWKVCVCVCWCMVLA